MTKVQIAAKSLLTGLIIYAAVALLRPLAELPHHGAGAAAPLILLLAAFYVGVIVSAAWYIIVVSDHLVTSTVDRDALAPGRSQRLLAQALTLTMVAVGLLLLPRAVPTLVAILKLPFVLRPIINEAIIEGGFPLSLRVSPAEWLRRLHALVRMLLAAYLIFGAPQLVRWQIRRATNQTHRPE